MIECHLGNLLHLDLETIVSNRNNLEFSEDYVFGRDCQAEKRWSHEPNSEELIKP
jgi:hypothetical protein